MQQYPYAIFISGLPGTGKSYFARHLAARLNAVHLFTDQIREQLDLKGQYDEASKHAVYNEMKQQLKETLKAGKLGVVDATFIKKALRKEFIEAVETLKVDLSFIVMTASEPVIQARINKTRKYSEADFKVYQKLKAKFEPFEHPYLILDSGTMEVEDMIEKVIAYANLDHD